MNIEKVVSDELMEYWAAGYFQTPLLLKQRDLGGCQVANIGSLKVAMIVEWDQDLGIEWYT